MNQLNELSGIPGAALPVAAAPSTTPSPGAQSVSLAGLRDTIKARQQPNKSQLRTFFHATLEQNLLIGPMSSQGYLAVENVAQFAPPGTPIAGQKISSPATDEFNRDLAFLMHGIYLEGEKGFEHPLRQDVLAIHEMEGAGPANRALLSAIQELNPPRETLSREVVGLWAWGAASSLMMRVLFEIGLGRALVDYLAPSATDEEKAWAAAQIQKVEEVLLDFEPVFNTLEVAKTVGFTLPAPEANAPVEGAA